MTVMLRVLAIVPRVLRHVFLYGCLLLAPVFVSAADHGDHQLDEAQQALISDDNLLIVDIILGKWRLAGDVFIYSSPEVVVVPLQPLFDGVEFPIKVDPVANKATGWFLSERNRFDLNVAERKVIIGDRELELPATAMVVSDGFDLYVDIGLLSDWFPFSVEMQTSKLRMLITSDSPLPLELQLEREKKRKRLLGYEGAEKLPLVADKYQLLGVPVIDFNLGGVVRDVEDNGASGDDIETDSSYSIQMASDIGGFQGSLSLSRASEDGDERERFTLYKRPNLPSENMPGELGYVALGDVFGASDALIFSGGDGLGLDLQFGGVRRASDFDKRVIEGDATPGWEVELYRNGALVDFQVVADDGRYRFEDIAVEYGENIFDVRLFGPQGQERSVREAINVGEQALPAGEFYARFNTVNLDEQLFDNEPDPPGSNEKKASGYFQYGLTPWLSASVKAAEHRNANVNGDDWQYLTFGLTAALPRAAIAFEHADFRDGGSADLFSVQSSINGTSISFSHKHYSDFASDRNGDGTLSDDTELRLTGTLTPFDWKTFSYQLIGNYEKNVSGSYQHSLESRVGFGLLGGRITADTIWLDGNYSDSTVRGRTRYLRSMGAKTSVRAALDYDISPDAMATGGQASVIWRPAERWRTQFSLNGDFTGGGNNSMGVALSYLFDWVTLSGNALVAEGGGSSFLLNAEFSMGRENDRRWRFDNSAQSVFGRLKARVFLDHDLDGVFSEGDEPLPGVYFEGRREWENRPTGDDGIVYLKGLRQEHPTRVLLDEGSLEDPYWRSAYTKSAFISHPGGLHTLDVPIIVTAEVEGSVLMIRNDQVVPVPGLPVQLFDGSDAEVAAAVTEFDGFFVIEGIAPGEYRLDLNDEALQKFSVDHFEPVTFSVSAEEGVVYLDPIILNPDQQSVASISESEPEESVESVVADSDAQQMMGDENPVAEVAPLADDVQTVESTVVTGSDLYFAVQVAAYQGELPARFETITDLRSMPGDSGLTRHITRGYDNYTDAAARQQALLDAGFEGAFVTVYRGSERLALAEVLRPELDRTFGRAPVVAEQPVTVPVIEAPTEPEALDPPVVAAVVEKDVVEDIVVEETVLEEKVESKVDAAVEDLLGEALNETLDKSAAVDPVPAPVADAISNPVEGSRIDEGATSTETGIPVQWRFLMIISAVMVTSMLSLLLFAKIRGRRGD